MYADLGSSTIPLLMPGQTVEVVGIGAGFAGLNNYRVIVDPQMNQVDGDWSNNVR